MSVIDIPMAGRSFIYNLPRTVAPFGSLNTNSKNISFFRHGRGKRPGTTQNTTGYSGTTKYITGMTQYYDSSGNEFLIVATSDGKFWKDTTNEITPASGVWTVDTLVHFCVRGNTVFASNGKDEPIYWKGSGNMTEVPGAQQPNDWTGSNWPKYIVAHSPGSEPALALGGSNIAGSSRLYAFGCPSNPFTVYVSTAYDPGTATSEYDWSEAGVHTLYIDTFDSTGLVAAHKFGERLVFFSRNESFILDDSNVTITNWGTYETRWKSGTISQRSVCRSPQGDLFIMSDDGHLYQASTTEKYGDYIMASLSQPHHMHEYFRENYKLDDTLHMQWNDKESSVNVFFETSAGSYYRGHGYHLSDNAWTPPLYNDSYDNGYKATASCVLRNSDDIRQVCTGDDKGYTWLVTTDNSIQDNGNGYSAVMDLTDVVLDEKGFKSELKLLSLLINSELGSHITYKLGLDGEARYSSDLVTVDSTNTLGSFTLGEDVLGGKEIEFIKRHVGGRGHTLSLAFESPGDGNDMKILNIKVITKDLRTS